MVPLSICGREARAPLRRVSARARPETFTVLREAAEKHKGPLWPRHCCVLVRCPIVVEQLDWATSRSGATILQNGLPTGAPF